MKSLLSFVFLFTTIINAQSPPKRIFLRNANVIDVKTGNISSGSSLIIEGERIAAIGKNVKMQMGDSVVDATGKFIIPGLWDMHTHAFGKYTMAFPLLLANGITGIRNMHTTATNPMQLLASIRQGLKDETILGPRLVANGQIVDGEPAYWPSTYVVHNAAEAKAAVDSLIRGGGDFIKVYSNLSRDAYFAIADECKKRNFPFEGHVPFSITVEEAAMAGQKSFEHNNGLLNASTAIEKELMQEYIEARRSHNDSIDDMYFRHMIAAQDDRKRKEVCNLLAAHQVWQCPTLINNEIRFDSTVANDSLVLKYMSASVYKATAERAKRLAAESAVFFEISSKSRNLHFILLKEMSKAGVPLLAGSDVDNPGLLYGFSLHQEPALFVKAGLTPLQALQAATLNPAKFFNWEKDLGTVEKDKYADLVLLDANPLINIQNTNKIFAVITNGRYLSRQRLDTLLADAAEIAKKN